MLGRLAKHAFVNDPPANYAVRFLTRGNGIWGSCATTTDASAPPDVVATSVCKECSPQPGKSYMDLSACLRTTHTGYPSPDVYRNLPDPDDAFNWGPNSNTYAATLAACCDSFNPSASRFCPDGIIARLIHVPPGHDRANSTDVG